MGPGIQEYPLLLHRETQQKESQINEYHKGMVNNGKSHLSTKGLNKPISHVKSPGKVDKKESSAIEKIARDITDGNEPSVFRKGRNQLHDDTQSKRTTNVGTALHKAQGPKRSLPERKLSESFLHEIPRSVKGSTQGSFCRVKDVPMQHFYSSKKEQLEKNHKEHVAEAAGPCSSKWREASVDEMFLNFESVQIIKEDAEDDSASDLSDSERIPIPPSPCTPPELILRAEEIDPVCLEHVPDTGFKESEYYYPDFLPPPFNTWDLKQLAIVVNVEGKTDFRPKPRGLLEKYIDRLLQLEWLQMQTVQNEKGKAAKGRPQTAPGTIRTLKSPGKGKALLSSLPKQAVPQESVTKVPRSYLSHRGNSLCEESRQLYSHSGHLKSSERTGYVVSSRRQAGEVRSELRKKTTAKQPFLNMQPSENTSKVQSLGNIRPPKQTPPVFPGSAVPLKGLKPYVCTNPKKNGNTSNYVPAKKPTGDRKVKPNGAKQTAHKFI